MKTLPYLTWCTLTIGKILVFDALIWGARGLVGLFWKRAMVVGLQLNIDTHEGIYIVPPRLTESGSRVKGKVESGSLLPICNRCNILQRYDSWKKRV